jgi:hypothetical protein
MKNLQENAAISIKGFSGFDNVRIVVVVVCVLNACRRTGKSFIRQELTRIIRDGPNHRNKCSIGTGASVRTFDGKCDIVWVCVEHTGVTHTHARDLPNALHDGQIGALEQFRDTSTRRHDNIRRVAVVEKCLYASICAIYVNNWWNRIAISNRRQRNSVDGAVGCDCARVN